MSDLTSPLGGDDLAKALRDAYGRGAHHIVQGASEEPETNEQWQAKRDAWIAQYMARLPAAEPIAAAFEPRVGDDVGQKAWGDLSPQETVRRVRCMADDAAAGTAIEAWRDACDAILKRLGVASAPSPEAGAGGDLGELVKRARLAAISEHTLYGNDAGSLYDDMADAIVDLMSSRSGKLVASTVSEEETKGADPYLTEATEALVARLEAELGVKGVNSVFRRALAIAKEASADAKLPKGLVGVVSGDVIREIDDQTPKSSPDQTPVDPQMTVEEAQDWLDSFDTQPGLVAADYRRRCKSTTMAPEVRDTLLKQAARIELALRTLQAGGEVRNG
ncbi:hypothetical protein ACLBYG_21835 [Methylobacterium sp. D53M]